jgi:hypothetical protein
MWICLHKIAHFFEHISSMQFATDPIKVKPYVRAYLTHQYQRTRSGIILIPSKDPVMIYLVTLLGRMRTRRDAQTTLDHYTAEVKIALEHTNFKLNGYCLTRTNTVNFQLFLEGTVKDRLYYWYRVAKSYNEDVELKTVVEDFRKEFGFEEENLPYETAIKSLYRYRTSLNPRQ